MGYLQRGVWHEDGDDTARGGGGGEIVRAASQFRDWVTAGGSSGFKAEPGRYHLYVPYGCPWAHRAHPFRKLKRLEEIVSVSVVDAVISEGGWAFRDGFADTVNGFAYRREAYLATEPQYTGRVTVPVLWDKRTHRIVNNESSEIIRAC